MDAEAFYTLTLPVALVAAVLSLLTAARLRLFSGAMLGAAVALVVASAAVHFMFGHSPDSTEPMSMTVFAAEHRAYWIILAICGVSAIYAHLSR